MRALWMLCAMAPSSAAVARTCRPRGRRAGHESLCGSPPPMVVVVVMVVVVGPRLFPR